MTRFCWLILTVFLIVLMEIMASNLGIFFAGPFFLCFYLTVSHGWRHGLMCGAVVCVVSEIVLGRQMTILPLLTVPSILGCAWRRYGDRRFLTHQVLPGIVLGLCYASFFLVFETGGLGPPSTHLPIRQALLILAGSVFISIVIFPLLVLSLDAVSHLIDEGTYRQRTRLRRG